MMHLNVAELLHVYVGSCHDLEHRLQVLGVAAHGPTAEVLLLSARGGRELVLCGHDTCTNMSAVGAVWGFVFGVFTHTIHSQNSKIRAGN